MTISKIYELLKLGVDSLDVSIDYKIGTLTDLEVFLSAEEYRFPLLYLVFPEKSTAQIPMSYSTIDTHTITGVLFMDYDIDATEDERKSSISYADDLLTRYVRILGSLDDGGNNWFSSVQLTSMSPEFRSKNSVASGVGFVITATSANLLDDCCG